MPAQSTPDRLGAAQQGTSCPRCGKQFRGQTIGAHAWKCPVTMEELFWAKVNKHAPGGCWEWTASRKEKGYGQFIWRGKMHRAHRLAWALSGRELPERPLELAHSCDNRLCVNPDHLSVATHSQNMADCKAKRRHAHGERNLHAKLTAAQVAEIKRSFWRKSKNEHNAHQLAARYGVQAGAIFAIANGRTWRYVA